jgi:hypothetical protein
LTEQLQRLAARIAQKVAHNIQSQMVQSLATGSRSSPWPHGQ